MDPRFETMYESPENKIFQVVFPPDRVYHSRYLNASVCDRYRYNVHEVRNKADITVMKGEVFLDNHLLTQFIRIEYTGNRLVEKVRDRGRQLRSEVMIDSLKLKDFSLDDYNIKMQYCNKVGAYQVEIWATLETTVKQQHDMQVLNMMGRNGSITRIRPFSDAISKFKEIINIEINFRESDIDLPYGYPINDPARDYNNNRNYQVPDRDNSTVDTYNYLITFQRGWFIQKEDTSPVPYKNALMESHDPEFVENGNEIDMFWYLQRELGGNLIYFHEVNIPPGHVEGTHQHLGSEELYYFTAGEGEAYMRVGDDPTIDDNEYPTTKRFVYQLEEKECKVLPAKPGTVIFTKSGGMHGVKNTGTVPLQFVAFGYQCT